MKQDGISDLQDFYIVKAYHTKKPQKIPANIILRNKKKQLKPTKKKIEPKHEMKPLHWKPIIVDPDSVKRTLWEEIDERPDFVDFTELADLFRAQSNKWEFFYHKAHIGNFCFSQSKMFHKIC